MSASAPLDTMQRYALLFYHPNAPNAISVYSVKTERSKLASNKLFKERVKTVLNYVIVTLCLFYTVIASIIHL